MAEYRGLQFSSVSATRTASSAATVVERPQIGYTGESDQVTDPVSPSFLDRGDDRRFSELVSFVSGCV